MLDYVLVVIAALAVFAQALLGFLVTTRPPSEQRRIYYEIAFGVIGAVGFVAIIWGGIRTAETQARIDASMGQIQRGQDALPNKVITVMARLLGVPEKEGRYPGSVIDAISSKIEDLQKRQVAAPIIIPGGTTYAVPTISALIDIQRIKATRTILILPKNPYVGERFDIKFSGDFSDDGTATETWIKGNGYSIDGLELYSLNFSNQAITITFDGRRWIII